jgi:mannose-6-phosphate isomerase
MTARCDQLLRFEPIFRRYLWGGRRLSTILGKVIDEGDDYAESWEIVDHGADQSVVTSGALAGRTLGDLVRDCRRELFGRHADVEHFPLLFKFLDCNRTLSVQVHPNDEQAALLDPPDLGKTEAWVVLHADPGSKIYAGLKPGVTRSSLAAAIDAGNIEQGLHSFEATAGDCVFIPAGTVHALGAGLVIAEIQQASNTTFRLFDWNRVDATGQPRPLHVEQSLDTIDYAHGPINPQRPKVMSSERERLVECDKFMLDRCTMSSSAASPMSIGDDDRFHLLAVIEGTLEVAGDAEATLARGATALVPAAAGRRELRPQGRAVVLDIYLPD